MTKQKIIEEINTVLLQMGVSPKAITENASFYNDLGLDSLDVAELMMEIENNLGLPINCVIIEQLETINDTINYLHQLEQRASCKS